MDGEFGCCGSRTRALWVITLVLAAVLTAGSASAAAVPPLRLIDTNKLLSRPQVIDGETKRVLMSFARAHEIRLTDVPEKPHLRFAIGLGPEPASGRVLFDVVLLLANKKRLVAFQQTLEQPGWTEVDVDLSQYDLTNAVVTLRKTLVEGDRSRFATAEWAEPTLLSGKRSRQPSVILVSLDTVRADRVGAYGHSGAQTPALDALARDGVLYRHAYSSSMWTVPSHRALLSGRFPGPSDVVPGSTDGTPYWLAEHFHQDGYLTAGFTGGGYVAGHWGFSNGFDSYYTYPQPPDVLKNCTPERFDGKHVFERARRWLRATGDQPFFLFVHTYDAHDRCPVWPNGVGPFALWPDPGPEGRTRVISYYDSVVTETDALLGSLMRELEASGAADNTIVVVTSDHGEALWEHGFFGHGCVLKPYEGIIHVPLIVRPVGKAPKKSTIDQPVSAVDVAPTLLALAGLEKDPKLDGYVLPGLGLDARPPASPIFVGCDNQVAVRIGADKLLSLNDTVGELYDLGNDPDEKKNLATTSPAVAKQLQDLARDYRRRVTERSAKLKAPTSIDDATRERLRTLGYIE